MYRRDVLYLCKDCSKCNTEALMHVERTEFSVTLQKSCRNYYFCEETMDCFAAAELEKAMGERKWT